VIASISRPNSPPRLLAVLAASIAFFAIVGAAAFAVVYIVQDQRAIHRVSAVAAATHIPTQSELGLPKGVIALQRVKDAGEFEQVLGFKPFIPKQLPDTTKDDLSLSITLPDDNGVRLGRIGYSMSDAAVEGITGPTVVLMESQGTPAPDAGSQLMRLTSGNGRALVATIACKGLVIDVQLFFGPAPQPGEPFLTPYMTGVGQEFLDGLNRQCGNPP
jgi:hypothetical protein